MKQNENQNHSVLYYLFKYLEEAFNFPGVFEFITFRAALAIILSLVISFLFGERIIQFLKRLQIGESIRDLGLAGQKEKEGTPTMGGVIIIMATIIPCLLLAKLDNVYILLMILATTWMGIIGFVDDYIKVFKKDKKGLKGRFKILGQVGLGLIVGMTMLMSDEVVVRLPYSVDLEKEYNIVETRDVKEEINDKEVVNLYAYVKEPITNVPFLKDSVLDYAEPFSNRSLVWLIFIPIIIFIVTAVSNAANLTDGIDGLATGVSAIIGATLGILAYVSGNTVAADYLDILYLPGSEELVIFSACFLGACIGFLWFNSYPAQIFMGDTGSLTIGGIIAALAILLRKELLIPILCGIFLVESLSVVMQVSYFKYTKKKYGAGRRIFLMSPLHHHYQKKGLHEAKIVTRFWIVGIMLAVITIITLKVR